MYNLVYSIVDDIRQSRPLVLNLTNLVTMDFIANGLLSLGASPIMTNACEELRDLLTIASVVVINIGTLDGRFIQLCEKACEIANELGKPIIFDPVGAGASQYRTNACLNILEKYQVAIIRGNVSEVMALCGDIPSSKGVDSTLKHIEYMKPIQDLSVRHHATIAVSGEVDVIVTAQQVNQCHRGSAYMPMITGSGCLLTAIISAFHAIETDSHQAALAAMHFYGICGEQASQNVSGPGQFKSQFVDALAQLPVRSDYEAA